MGNWWIGVGVVVLVSLLGGIGGYLGGLELGFRVGRRRGERQRWRDGYDLDYDRERKWRDVQRELGDGGRRRRLEWWGRHRG